MNEQNQKLEKIIKEGIINTYKLNVNKNFEDVLLQNIYLQEKFMAEDIKSFKIVKIISLILLGAIVFSIILIFGVSISAENIYNNSTIGEILFYVFNIIEYLFSWVGIKSVSNLIFIAVVSFILIFWIFYFDKIISKKNHNL